MISYCLPQFCFQVTLPLWLLFFLSSSYDLSISMKIHFSLLIGLSSKTGFLWPMFGYSKSPSTTALTLKINGKVAHPIEVYGSLGKGLQYKWFSTEEILHNYLPMLPSRWVFFQFSCQQIQVVLHRLCILLHRRNMATINGSLYRADSQGCNK